MTRRAPSRPSVPAVLAINGGSSSIKFALFEENGERRRLHGKMDRIGLGGACLASYDSAGRQTSFGVEAPDHKTAAELLTGWLDKEAVPNSIKAVGHRVVHGMERTGPERVTPELLAWLNRISPYDPDHLPLEIGLMEAFRRRCPGLPQFACFDTAFHSVMPRAARIIPIPRRYDTQGVRRYGFHGLSYAYLMEELARLGGAEAARGRVILAHLGNGASMAAVLDGRGVDTTMGFTPAGGLPMGTRPGDIDPGVAWHLMRTESLTPERFNRVINHDSGLLGVSETSSDMRDLLELQARDVRAAEAVELFCYQARKWIGAFAAALGGLDILVFSGGIGENSAEVRSRICAELGFLGVDLDEDRNAANGAVISKAAGRVSVRVIRTDEELMIARAVRRSLAG